LTGYSNIGCRPSSKKTGNRKTLYFHWSKIGLLALHTAAPEPGWGLPIKSRKIDRKINFLRLKMTRKNSLQDSLKTFKPIFGF
jgi:hypothetical protein